MPTKNPSSRNSGSTSIFASDIVWYMFALSFVVAFVLLFFMIFQPNILRSFTQNALNNSANMVLDVEQKYNQFSNETLGLLSSTNSLDTNGEICNENEFFEGLTEKNIQLDQLTSRITTQEKFTTLPRVIGFSDQIVIDINTVNYMSYQEAIDYLMDEKQFIQEAFNFLDFRNEWIDTCLEIQNSSSSIDIAEACADILPQTSVYLQSGNEFGVDALTSLVEVCEETQTSIYIFSNTWNFEFLKAFSDLMDEDTSSVMLDKKDRLIENFNSFKSTLESRDTMLRNYLRDRDMLKNQWYLMDFDY